ncbi:periplasmic binding protein-like I [Rhizoclosmatium globosum]|uniref:Periplasmic binding protein-like I n=1 Tax=Rhizoclosmatium globosum TaxID=329046 RepID=A0A1Y2CBL6_9FUNG|nr:periplasmic binding protein-like I [Rhizoclosmatium globosum]|eukprot:ORY44441.1 periplasmic binding protein-like I [Rhizoclosmatium globosum]
MSTLAWVLLQLTGFVLGQSFTNPIIGFYPGTSTIPSKQRYNVTIALILPYKSFWNFTSSAEYKNCGGFCSWMRQMDSGAEMAITEINNCPTILPEITVNILRVQGWDQKISPGNGIGGAAPVAIELSERRDVIGVVGDVTDQSSMITAGILSQYHMPICGGSPNLPDLSNKANYPFYFRVAYSNKWGSDIASLLQEWNVKRVALVYDADDSESVGACFDITQSLFRSDVIVLSKRSYHGLSNRYDYDSIIEEFLLVDTRYIILCAQAWSNSYHFIQKAAEMGLITPQHQWIVTQPPYPPDYTGTALDPNFKAIQSRWENCIRLIH